MKYSRREIVSFSGSMNFGVGKKFNAMKTITNNLEECGLVKKNEFRFKIT